MWVWTPWAALLLPKVPDLFLTQTALAAATILAWWGWHYYKKNLLDVPKWWQAFFLIAVLLLLGHWWSGHFNGQFRWWPVWSAFSLLLFTLWLAVPLDVKRTSRFIAWMALSISLHVLLAEAGGVQWMKSLLSFGSVFGNPTNMGVWLVLTLPWVWKARLFKGWSVLPVGAAIYFSHSAAAYLGAGLAFVLVMPRKSFQIGAACALAAALGFGAYAHPDFFSLGGRREMWSALPSVWYTHHLTGIGFGTFRLLELHNIFSYNQVWGHPWNLLIRLAVEGGAIGVMGAVWGACYAPWKAWWRVRETRMALVLFSLVCLLSLGGSDLTTLLIGTWWMNQGGWT